MFVSFHYIRYGKQERSVMWFLLGLTFLIQSRPTIHNLYVFQDASNMLFCFFNEDLRMCAPFSKKTVGASRLSLVSAWSCNLFGFSFCPQFCLFLVLSLPNDWRFFLDHFIGPFDTVKPFCAYEGAFKKAKKPYSVITFAHNFYKSLKVNRNLL